MKRKVFIVLLLTLGGVAGFLSSLYFPISGRVLKPKKISCLRIVDRNGRLVREVLSNDDGPSFWIPFQETPLFLTQATLAAEDRRFFSHSGIDYKAVARALYDNIRLGRIVSGASTISEQVVRNLFHFPRTAGYKIIEAWYALRLERTLGKNEILEQYLNRAPYGNQTYGVEAAARLYFGKKASRLSLAESAFLAAIPQAPSLNEPYRHFMRTCSRQKAILREMLRAGRISNADYKQSVNENVRLVSHHLAFKAPHFSNLVIALLPRKLRGEISTVETTLDLDLQVMAEDRLQTHLRLLRKNHVTNGAVIILDNQSGSILAMVGSADFFDPDIDGEVNGALALRSPGSTLKPFTYALALEHGFTAASILPDIQTHLSVQGGDFAPENYDEKYHGPVRLREALANSYNIPAVYVQKKIGTASLLHALHLLGFQSLKKDPDYYGPTLTLGDGEVSLLELTVAYRELSLGGVSHSVRIISGVRDGEGNMIIDPDLPFSQPGAREGIKIFSPQTAYIVTRILSDNAARVSAFGEDSPLSLPFPCAAKTGTSRNYRDNWTIGFTPRYTVGVWVGNFDSSPMEEVSGITGAAPIFHDIMTDLEEKNELLDFLPPEKIVEREICSLSGEIPGPFCHNRMIEIFAEGKGPQEICSYHQARGIAYPPEYLPWAFSRHLSVEAASGQGQTGLEIRFPTQGSVFQIDPVLPRKDQGLKFEAVIPSTFYDVAWLVDGRFQRPDSLSQFFWQLKPGIHRIQVTGRLGKRKITSSPVSFTVLP